tara:strand:- start:2822 stop:3142 length:321 start_codon:yes stop_codon:yes gene_type:complete
MRFQSIVIVIAIIVLIATLSFIGYVLYSSQHNQQFPPVQAACPDYWVSEGTNCINKRNLGTCPGPTDFVNIPHYQGHQGDCNKSKWAKDCGVTWEGITNNPSVCKS